MFKFVKFAELPVQDQDRAVSFYTDKLGLKVIQDTPYNDGWRWIELEIPGAETHILLTRKSAEEKTETDMPRMVLIVGDIDKTFRKLTDSGIVFTQEPTRAPWNPDQVFAQFRDSEGNGIVISSR